MGAIEHARFCRDAIAHQHKLRDIDNSDHPPGEFNVMFQKSALLDCLSHSQVASLAPLPGVLPDSPEQARRLATSLAESIRAAVGGFNWFGNLHVGGFELVHATKDGIRQLARDPRVATVEPNYYLHKG